MINNAALSIDEVNNLSRNSVYGQHPATLTDIYQDDVNLAVWKNSLSAQVVTEANSLIASAPQLKVVMIASTDTIIDNLKQAHSELETKPELCQHVAMLVDMFATLFEPGNVGVRMSVVDNAMCPKFHVDMVPCRLVTTLSGTATQWLKQEHIDRTKLGAGSLGLTDEKSGIYADPAQIEQLEQGDVALLKGEGWHNNQGEIGRASCRERVCMFV